MINNKKIIIVMPAYNAQATLKETFEAIPKEIVDDIVLVDTAGRLHNKVGLMDELKKISKIISKEWQGEVRNYLVIDATTGQNAMVQVELFNDVMPLDGIILTKLDGSSKGGVVFAIAKKFGVPIKWVGLGEGIDDLEKFDAKEFVENII